MTSWLGSTVSDKLAEALAYKTAKHHGIKPEPSLLLDVSENGSNLKVRVNMPTVSLHVLKVQGSVLTVTDGAVSIQARLSSLCKERFQNQYSPSLSFIERKSITSTISDITHTSLGPLNSRIQLLLSSLTISHNPLDLSGTTVDRITSVHTIEKIRTYLIQLQQFHQSASVSAAELLTADHDTVSALVPTDTSDLDMVEAPSNAPNAAERTTPLKRPHTLSSPNHPGSHRVVKPRIHNEDQDVIIQTGINLQQPVQLQSNDSQELKRLLSLNKSGARASVSTAREQALRLGGLMSAQMAPPPVPAAGNSNVQPQTLSQPATQSTSQTFESQIPMADAPVVESAGTDPYPENTSVVQPESGNIPARAIGSHTIITATSAATTRTLAVTIRSSSSFTGHLQFTSVGYFVFQYSRIAAQSSPSSKLLEKYSSWWPSRPGTTFPHPNVPMEVLDKAEKAAERRAVKQKEEERNMQLQEENEREPASLSNALLVIQGTQDTILSWESSPEHHTRPRSRMDTLRRSTNFVDPEPLLAKLPPGELPPDSSAEDHMQVDKPEVDDFLEQIPSSPPSGSVSQESYASGLDIPVPPQPSLRQLPEYPLGSPEENSSRPNPGAQPDKSELQDPPAKSISYNESRPERDVGASSPILEVAASPQPRKELEGKSSLLSQRPEDDTVMDDKPEANNDPVVDGQERHIVAESPKPQSRRDRRTSWGLSESAETIEQRRSRMKREFFEQRQKTTTPNTNLSIMSESLPTAQLSDEIGKNLEAPDLDADSQPDPMEVDGPPLEPAEPANPSIAMIDQWRRQSSQKDDRSMCETSSTGKRPESAAPGSNVSDHAVPGPSVTEPAALKVNAPESPVQSVRSLPSKPLRIADVQVRESSLQTRQQINKGPFGEPSRALWVGSLPEDIDNRQLEKLFAEFNPISVSAKNQSGFVNFANTETACRAFEAKHNSPLDGKVIVCKFAAPRGPVPMDEFSDRRPIPDLDRLVKPASTPARSTANKSPALTVDDLFRQLVSKRNFKGNRTAFETLCKDLHTSSDIPTPQWDNYVVLQPAEYLPWASRTIANGGKVVDYEAYWRDHLQKTAKPDLDPVLTPARLDAIFSKTRAVESPPIRSSAPVIPQTTPGARRPMPPPVQETPPSTSSHTPRAAADDLRRSVVERNAQNTTSSLRDVASEQPHPFSDLPEPRRTSKWLRQNFTRDPKGRIVQQKLYQMYKEAFANATVPLILGGPFIEHVFNIFPGQTTTAFDEQGNKVFYCTGLRIKSPTRTTRTETVPTYPPVDESLKNRYFDPAGTARYNDAQFHPIFRRKNFPIMDDYDYELLKPVLKVATELLSSFDTLGFFKGLFNAWKFPGTPEEQHLLGKGMMWRFSPRNIDSWDEAMETIQQLRELGDYVTWQYDDSRSAHRQASMCTYQDPTKPIYPEGRVFFKQQGYYTQICMSTSFRDALARKHRVEDIHPELDQYAADLRTRFYMAMIMVHETAHAFHNVFNSTGHFQKHEPFLNDGRVAELGHAITKHLFGNVIQITGANPEHLGVPFGFCFFDWPDSANRGLKKVMRFSLAKTGVHTHTYYVLPMSYILKVLHPQFWTDEVMRYGTIASLRPPKDLGVRYRYDDYELWLNEHESDVDFEVLPPDELQPDVAEGIITQDTAIPLDFHSEAYKDQLRNLATHTRPWEFVKDLNMKYFPLTWDLIDRFDPEANVSGNVVAPLNADPRSDAVVRRNELRTFLRKTKLRKMKEKEKKIKKRKEQLDVLRKNKGSKVTKA
ncbi:hypothetical protein KCU78_g6443, partial [Aureobasidium melanogenum]